jgi:hypothetical protein
MESLEKRKQSFIDKGWDQRLPVSIDELSEAGFYYTGVDDLVKCFHCNGGIYGWGVEDNAFLAHEQEFPKCNYMNLRKSLDLKSNRQILEQNGNLIFN